MLTQPKPLTCCQRAVARGRRHHAQSSASASPRADTRPTQRLAATLRDAHADVRPSLQHLVAGCSAAVCVLAAVALPAGARLEGVNNPALLCVVLCEKTLVTDV